MDELIERFKFVDTVRRNGSNNRMKHPYASTFQGKRKRGGENSIHHGPLVKTEPQIQTMFKESATPSVKLGKRSSQMTVVQELNGQSGVSERHPRAKAGPQEDRPLEENHWR